MSDSLLKGTDKTVAIKTKYRKAKVSSAVADGSNMGLFAAIGAAKWIGAQAVGAFALAFSGIHLLQSADKTAEGKKGAGIVHGLASMFASFAGTGLDKKIPGNEVIPVVPAGFTTAFTIATALEHQEGSKEKDPAIKSDTRKIEACHAVRALSAAVLGVNEHLKVSGLTEGAMACGASASVVSGIFNHRRLDKKEKRELDSLDPIDVETPRAGM